MSFSYFNKLNYTLANEDTTFEYDMMPRDLGHVVSVAGSGGRVLPLAASRPKHISCVDLSHEQLYLTELRMEACRQKSHAEFLKLFGYEDCSAEERKDIFSSIKISEKAKAFLEGVFGELDYESLLYIGKWESTFAKLAKANEVVTGKAAQKIFDCKTLDEQVAYYDNDFPKVRFRVLLFFLGNRNVFNALLYKGHFVKKNVEGSYEAYYSRAFEHLFRNTLLRENFFMQIIFFGKIMYKDGWPVECDPKVFAESKEALANCDVTYNQGNLLETIPKIGKQADFIGLSDVPSYFSGDVEKGFMQQLHPHLNSSGLAVVRSYLRIPFRPDLRGFENVSESYAEAASAEKTGMYYIDVYRKI